MEPQTIQAEPKNEPVAKSKGGRPFNPAAPTSAEECCALIAAESVKTKPSATKQHLWANLLEQFNKQEARIDSDRDQRLAQLETDNVTLQTEIDSLRRTVAALESLRVPHDELETVKAERDSLRRDLHSANASLTRAADALKDAVKTRDLARESQRTAEQNAAALKHQLDAQYQKLIDPLVTSVKALSGSSIDAREKRFIFETLLTEFRRMHALALATRTSTPAPLIPVQVKIVRQATPEELAKALADRIEADRVENAAQPRSIEPSVYEVGREKAAPRAPDLEPTRPISGGADFSDWVK